MLSHTLSVSSEGVLQLADLMYQQKQVDSGKDRDKISKMNGPEENTSCRLNWFPS